MPKVITLTLTGVRYHGSSIGNDVRVEIDLLGKTTSYETKLKKGEHVAPHLELGAIPIGKVPFKVSATIRVIERDVLFPDKGQVEVRLKIDPAAPFPQRFTHTIAVRESRGFLTKRTARFEVTIEADSQKRIPTVEDPKWTGNFRDDPDDILLARLIFGEGENQSREAKVWIGSSVLNRVRAKAWPNTLHEVILQKGQYDPFKKKDKNFKKIIDPLAKAGKPRQRAWRESCDVASRLVSGRIPNSTAATHFHGKGITRAWFEAHIVPNGKFLRKIGDTFFYWSPN